MNKQRIELLRNAVCNLLCSLEGKTILVSLYERVKSEKSVVFGNLFNERIFNPFYLRSFL